MGGRDKGRYRGKLNLKSLINIAVEYVPNKITSIRRRSHLSSFVLDGANKAAWKHSVLLFTEKYETPNVYRVLASQFDGKLALAEIRGNNTKLAAILGIETLPSLVVAKSGASLRDHKSFKRYKGQMKKDDISKWLRTFKQRAPRVKKHKSRSKTEKEKKKEEKKYSMRELTKQSAPDLLGKRCKLQWCAVAILESESQKSMAEKIARGAALSSYISTFNWCGSKKQASIFRNLPDEVRRRTRVPGWAFVRRGEIAACGGIDEL